MKKIFLFIVFGSFIAFGQNNTVQLPNITPPSPEAYQMTKYGDVPIDEFNGKVNLNIPLYEFTAGDLKLPLSLTYNGAGVKVKDVPTQVGMNWMLNAGGLISREIRDLADEEAYYANNKRMNLSLAQLGDLNQTDCTNQAANLRLYLDDTEYDTEVDVFNFNFNGYNGSFYLDDLLKPKLLKNESELKIEIVGNLYNDKTFVITDPNGVKYYFGGLNACEISSTESIVNGVHQSNASGGGMTSFYLTKIVHPINGIINLEYETIVDYRYVLNHEYTKTENVVEGVVGGLLEENCSYPGDSYSINMLYCYIDNPKYVKRIYSTNNSNEVIFERINLNGTDQTSSIKTVLKKIMIKNNTTLIQNIDLSYLGLNNLTEVERFFLSKIELNNVEILSNKNEVYSFEYNDPLALPSRNSKSIDKLGFFNNKNNQDIVPCFPDDYPSLCPNRTSNFEYSSKGVLKKVIYPTKGYTEFEYEPIPFVEEKFTTIYDDTYSIPENLVEDEFIAGDYGVVYGNGRYNRLHYELPNPGTNVFDADVNFSMPIIYGDYVTISLNATTTGNVPANRVAKVIMKITDLSTSIVTSEYTYTTLSFIYRFIATHKYKIELDLVLPNIIAENASFGGNFSFKLHTGFHAPTGYSVRLKRTKDFPETTAQPIVKRFYYKSYDKLNDIQADQIHFLPSLTSNAYIMACPTGSMAYNYYTVLQSTLSSEYNFLDFTFPIFFRDYNNVTVSYGGDNFENGGLEKTFLLEVPTHDYLLQAVTTNSFTQMLNPYLNSSSKRSRPLPVAGNLIKEKTFANINGTLYKIKENKYEYEYPLLQEKKLSLYGHKTFTYYGTSDIYENVYSFEMPYGHHGFFDPLNADTTNSCNCHPYSEIEGFMKDEMWDYVLDQGDALIINNFWPNINSGQYDLVYSFSNNYESVTIVLKNKIGICHNANTLSNYNINYYFSETIDFKKVSEKSIDYIEPIPANLVPHEPSGLDDQAIIYPTQDQIEAPYKKIITTQNYQYGTLKGLPTVITTNTSDSSIVNKTVNTYVNTAASLPNIPNNQNPIYTSLISQNRVGSPIQVQQFQNNQLLSTQRTLFNNFTSNSVTKILPEKIQIGKGDLTVNPLEDKAIFYNYDQHFNPVVMGYKDAPKTRYMFNTDGLVVAKIENYTATSLTFPLIVGNVDNTNCALQTQYPNSLVTVFKYNLITKKLIQTTDSRCQNSFYEYDNLHRLKLIKDHNGNIVKEFDQQFKPQN